MGVGAGAPGRAPAKKPAATAAGGKAAGPGAGPGGASPDGGPHSPMTALITAVRSQPADVNAQRDGVEAVTALLPHEVRLVRVCVKLCVRLCLCVYAWRDCTMNGVYTCVPVCACLT